MPVLDSLSISYLFLRCNYSSNQPPPTPSEWGHSNPCSPRGDRGAANIQDTWPYQSQENRGVLAISQTGNSDQKGENVRGNPIISRQRDGGGRKGSGIPGIEDS